MRKEAFPILEFDASERAVINPEMLIGKVPGMPERMVLCFFAEAIEKLLQKHEHEVVAYFRAESLVLPVYALNYNGQRIALLQAGVGAPVGASQIDETAAMGVSKYMVCGSCGVLEQELVLGHLIIPDAAVRDEGASYHYAAPAREIMADPHALCCIERALKERNIPYVKAKTWTTDAFYRETPEKVAMRKGEGCVCVEMEASAYMAVAQFRGLTLGQILYAGDNLGAEEYDFRGYNTATDVREYLLNVALEACLYL